MKLKSKHLYAVVSLGMILAGPSVAQMEQTRVHQPEVWHSVRPADATVSSAGDLNISIPLLTVPGRGLSFDIALAYQSGIQVQQRASWVGLGWNFEPGSITRDVQGGVVRPYSLPQDPNTSYNPPSAYYDIDFDGAADMQQDAYYVHLPMGTFPMTKTPLTAFSVPLVEEPSSRFFINEWRAWKVQATSSSLVSAGSPSVLGGVHTTSKIDYSQFVITTDDGTRYVFGEPTIAYFEGTPGSTNQGFYVNAWRLRAILSPTYTGGLIPTGSETGGWILFNYAYSTAQQQPRRAWKRPWYQITYLSQIVTPTHVAEFETEERMDVDDYEAMVNSSDDAKDVGLYRNLKAITLKTRSGDVSRKVEFVYDKSLAESRIKYPNAYLNSLPTCTSRRGGWGPCAGRTTLKQIILRDANNTQVSGYSMGYDGRNPESPFSQYNTARTDTTSLYVETKWRHVDDYGYYNRLGNEADISVPQIDADTLDGTAWNLTRLTYPTGGSDRFQYANDIISDESVSYRGYYEYGIERGNGVVSASTSNLDYSDSYSFVARTRQGGSIVRLISRRSGMGDSTVTRYSYGPGRSSGVPGVYWIKDLYLWSQHVQANLNPENTFVVSGNRGHSRVVYEWIRQTIDGAGSSLNYYTTPYSHPSDVLLPQTVLYMMKAQRSLIIGNQDWNWGRPWKTEVYTSTGTLLSRSTETLSIGTQELAPVWDASAWGSPLSKVSLRWGYMRPSQTVLQQF